MLFIQIAQKKLEKAFSYRNSAITACLPTLPFKEKKLLRGTKFKNYSVLINSHITQMDLLQEGKYIYPQRDREAESQACPTALCFILNS